jgi:hypothetical protein
MDDSELHENLTPKGGSEQFFEPPRSAVEEKRQGPRTLHDIFFGPAKPEVLLTLAAAAFILLILWFEYLDLPEVRVYADPSEAPLGLHIGDKLRGIEVTAIGDDWVELRHNFSETVRVPGKDLAGGEVKCPHWEMKKVLPWE